MGRKERREKWKEEKGKKNKNKEKGKTKEENLKKIKMEIGREEVIR